MIEPINKNDNFDEALDGDFESFKRPNEPLTAKTKSRGGVLKKALETINGERQDEYGAPEDSFQIIADFWTTYLNPGVRITARQVSEMMMLFKIARMKGQKPRVDNYVDCAGYCGIAADMLEGDNDRAT